MVHMDYLHLKATGERTDQIEDVWATTLVVVHVGTGLTCSTAVEKKGAQGVREGPDLPALPAGYVVQVVLTFLKRLCLDTVILQTDGEPAIKELANEIEKARTKPTRLRNTPAHSSQSNGAVESAIGHISGQARAMRAQVESAHGVVLTPNWCVWPWLIRHASWLMGRFSVRASGRTAYEEAFDSEWRGDLCVLGEVVLFREAASYTGDLVMGRRKRKADKGWAKGIWLGRAEETNEHVVGNELGVFLTRTVRRVPKGQRADGELLRSMRGVPWEPRQESKPGRPKKKPQKTATLLSSLPAERTPTKTVTTTTEDAAKLPPDSTTQAATSGPNVAFGIAPEKDQGMGAYHGTAASSTTTPRERPADEAFGPVVEARLKKSRIAAVTVDTEERFTVDEDPFPGLEEAFGEAYEYDVEEEKRDRQRVEEIRALEKFDSFEGVPRDEYNNHKILGTRFVDTDEKSRFVAKEFDTGPTDQFYAQATTMTTNRLVDVLATKRGHGRLIMDIHRAFLHLVEDELVLVEPPDIWKQEEIAAGRDGTQLWRTKKILYGGRKAPKAWLDFFGALLVEKAGLVQSRSAPQFFRDTQGDMLLELHMDDLHAEGPDNILDDLAEVVKETFQSSTRCSSEHVNEERLST